MADEEILDLDEPYPNVVIERMRRAAKQAIDDVALNVSDIQSGFAITDMLLQFVSDLLDQGQALKTRADAAQLREQTEQADIDDLQKRVSALENPTAP